jgi:hypothetical protein
VRAATSAQPAGLPEMYELLRNYRERK